MSLAYASQILNRKFGAYQKPSSSVPFDPSQVPNLVAWYDASSLANIIDDNGNNATSGSFDGNIAKWKNRYAGTGTLGDLNTVSGVSMPTLADPRNGTGVQYEWASQTSLNSPNGDYYLGSQYGIYTSSGSPQGLVSSGWTPQSLWIFVAATCYGMSQFGASQVTFGYTHNLQSGEYSGNYAVTLDEAQNIGSSIQLGTGAFTYGTTGGGWNDNSTSARNSSAQKGYVLTGTLNYGSSYTSTLNLSNGSNASVTSSTAAHNDAHTLTSFSVGISNNPSSYFANSSPPIGEVIMYNAAPTSAQITALQSYLSTKWA